MKTSLINTWGGKQTLILTIHGFVEELKKRGWQNREIRTILSVGDSLESTSRVERGVDGKTGIMSSFGSWISFIFLGCPDMLERGTTPFSERGKKIPHLKSLRWNVLENTERSAGRPNRVAPGLGYDAQSRRHNSRDFITISKRMAAAQRTPSVNKLDVVAMEKALAEFFLSWEWCWVDPACLCCSDLICAHMTAVVLPTEAEQSSDAAAFFFLFLKESHLQVEKLDMFSLKRLRLPKLRFPIIPEPQTDWKCLLKEGVCYACPEALWRAASPRLAGCGGWQHIVIHQPRLRSLARVHVEVLRGCLRAQPARLVVSVVCLKIVIQLWLCCMRRSDPSVSHKWLHKHRPEPDTHTLLYSCLCEAFTLTSINFPFFCAAKP